MLSMSLNSKVIRMSSLHRSEQCWLSIALKAWRKENVDENVQIFKKIFMWNMVMVPLVVSRILLQRDFELLSSQGGVLFAKPGIRAALVTFLGK